MATTYPATFSVTSLNGTNGFAVTRSDATRTSVINVSSAGDVNGDGIGDLLVGLPDAKPGSGLTGTAYVLFGRKSGFSATFDWSTLNGKNGFAITGNGASETFGLSVSKAGDLNGDGIDDFVVGGDKPGGRPDVVEDNGALYVVYGTRAGFAPTLSVTELNGKNGFWMIDSKPHRPYTDNPGLGNLVSFGGDLNGDGRGDLLVTDYNDIYGILGKAGNFPARLDVSALDGKDGGRIANTSPVMSPAGDVNGDGIADRIVEDRENWSQVVFGQKGSLAFTHGRLDGTNGFTIVGPYKPAGQPNALFSAGDVNGDGIGDLIGYGNRSPDSVGQTLYVLYGKKSGFAAQPDIDNIGVADGIKITGSYDGLNMRGIGDFNGDGIDDVAITSETVFRREIVDGVLYGDGGSTRFDASDVFIVFGRKGGFKEAVSLDSLDGTDGVRITGIPTSAERRAVSAGGDLNGDGFADLVVTSSAPVFGYETPGSTTPTYVIFGNTSFSGVTRGGGSGDDVVTGTIYNDTLNGFRGDDRLVGLAGDDRLNGGAGADRMEGGTGNDTYIVDNAGDRTIEAIGEGDDTVISAISYALAAGQEIEVLRLDPRGTAGLSLTGNELRNTLYGNAGDNLLTGGGGGDRYYGGAGDDLYAVGNAYDVIVEGTYEGNDTVVAKSNYFLNVGAHVETLQLATATGSAPLKLSGNEYAQVIRGNSGDNVLDGGYGSYSVPDGDDSLYGKRGDDTYAVRRAGDKVYEAAGEGKDTVVAFVDYALADGQEIEILQAAKDAPSADLTGNAFANTLLGGKGNNVLDGKLGADVLSGRGGEDTFVFSSALGGGNVDRITDFGSDDAIHLAKPIFTALNLGTLAADQFKNISTGKADTNDHILYKQETGQLFYDADGGGKGAAVWFATLDNKIALTAADILIV